MPADPTHRLTSIDRPLDRSFATNRAVLWLMPIAGVASGVAALVRGASLPHSTWWAIAGLLLVFSAWALARELAPDDNPAAFVSMAIALFTLPAVTPLSFLLLATTMLLIRIVNRTTGLPARVTDSAAVTLLVFALVYLTGNPVLGFVAAIAFVFDAVLSEPLRRQGIFAALCVLGAAVFLGSSEAVSLVPSQIHAGVVLLLAGVTLAYAVTLLLTRAVTSRGDATGTRLIASRVRAGMLVALLVSWQAFLFEDQGLGHGVVVWSAMGGVALTALVTRPLRKLAA